MRRVLLAAALVATLFSCSRPANTGEDAAQAEDRRKYQEELESRLDRVSREIEDAKKEIRAKWDAWKPEIREQRQQALAELERAEADARDKLAKLKTASVEGWTEFRRGVDKAVEDLQAGWERFKAEKLD